MVAAAWPSLGWFSPEFTKSGRAELKVDGSGFSAGMDRVRGRRDAPIVALVCVVAIVCVAGGVAIRVWECST